MLVGNGSQGGQTPCLAQDSVGVRLGQYGKGLCGLVDVAGSSIAYRPAGLELVIEDSVSVVRIRSSRPAFDVP